LDQATKIDSYKIKKLLDQNKISFAQLEGLVAQNITEFLIVGKKTSEE
jgi:hypothetical protein